MMGGEDAVLPLERFETDDRVRRVRAIAAERIVDRLEDGRGRRIRYRCHALDDLGERHRNTVHRYR